MELKPGSRWKSVVCDTEVIVVKPIPGDISLECGGAVIIPRDSEKPAGGTIAAAFSGGTLLGKRYGSAGLELLCIKGGAGSLSLNGQALEMLEAKKLPSSD